MYRSEVDLRDEIKEEDLCTFVFLECVRVRMNELETYYSGGEHIETTWERMRQDKDAQDKQVIFYIEALATMDSKDVWTCVEKCFEAIGYLGPSTKDYRRMKCLFGLRWCEWTELEKEIKRTENMKPLIDYIESVYKTM